MKNLMTPRAEVLMKVEGEYLWWPCDTHGSRVRGRANSHAGRSTFHSLTASKVVWYRFEVARRTTFCPSRGEMLTASR